MAAVWKAPVVFIIENNLYGEYTPAARDDADRRPRRAGEGLRDARRRSSTARTSTPCTRPSPTAVARARAGDGPTLLEMKTYRYRGHSRTDPAKYRAGGRARALEGARPDRRCSARRSPRRARCHEESQARCATRSSSWSTTAADARRSRPRSRPSRRPKLCLRRLETEPATRAADVVEMTLPRGRQRRARGRAGGGPDRATAWARTSPPPAASSRRTRGCRSSSRAGSATRRSARTASSASRSAWR